MIISYDEREAERLIKLYPAFDIKRKIEKALKYYESNPFQKKSKRHYFQEVKEALYFFREDEKPKKSSRTSNLEDEESKEELTEAYNLIVSMLKKYIEMKEEYYSVIALWIIGTYFYEKFSSYAYLYVNAMRGSGKSRLLKIIQYLSRNGKVILDIREAVLFRTAKGRTLCFDELESIDSKEKATLRELLNAAYKKGNYVERARKVRKSDGESYEIESFEVYTPICMANISGLNEILSSRCISIILERSDSARKIKLLEDFDNNPKIKEITDMLCSLCKKCMKKDVDTIVKWNDYILQKYTQTTSPTITTQYTQTTLTGEEIDFFSKIDAAGIDGRNLELFYPLFVISNYLGEEIFNNTLEIARKLVIEKIKDENTESIDVNLIEFISRGELLEYITPSGLIHKFRSFLNLGEKEELWMNSLWMGRALKRLSLVKHKRRVGRGVEVLLDLKKSQELLNKLKIPEEDSK